jgi:hypothetical protein
MTGFEVTATVAGDAAEAAVAEDAENSRTARSDAARRPTVSD